MFASFVQLPPDFDVDSLVVEELPPGELERLLNTPLRFERPVTELLYEALTGKPAEGQRPTLEEGAAAHRTAPQAGAFGGGLRQAQSVDKEKKACRRQKKVVR